MYYFTADIHFCDEMTMRTDNRPFKSIKQFDNFIIRDWKKQTKKGDTIFVIGDLLDCNGPDTYDWLNGLKLIKKSKLKADIVLIVGNNEQRVIDFFFDKDYNKFVEKCLEFGIKSVHKTLDISCLGKKFHLVHQIIHGDKKKFNLFGHTHLCSGLYHPYGICVSTDLNHFRLYSEDILKGYIERKHDYWEPDFNTNYINPFLKEESGKITNPLQKRKAYKQYLKESEFSLKFKQWEELW